MNTGNPTLLRIRLEELLQKLEKFDKWMERDVQVLGGAWARLDAVWDGVAYQDFTGSWNEMHAALRQYTMLCRRYEAFLKDRIEALERYERSQGEL